MRWKTKWERREKKRQRRQHGHTEDGRSVKYIQRIIKEKVDGTNRQTDSES